MTDTTKPASPTPSVDLQNRQQALLWRLVAACFGQGEKAQNLEALSKEIAKEVDVPDLVSAPASSCARSRKAKRTQKESHDGYDKTRFAHAKR